MVGQMDSSCTILAEVVAVSSTPELFQFQPIGVNIPRILIQPIPIQARRQYQKPMLL